MEVRNLAIRFLYELEIKIDNDIAKEVVSGVYVNNIKQCNASIATLYALEAHIDNDVIENLVDKLNDDNFREKSVSSLMELRSKIGVHSKEKLVSKLKNENADIRFSALNVLEAIPERLCNSTIQCIVHMLDDEDFDVNCLAVDVLMQTKSEFTIKTIRKIVEINIEDIFEGEEQDEKFRILDQDLTVSMLRKLAAELEDKRKAKRSFQSQVYRDCADFV